MDTAALELSGAILIGIELTRKLGNVAVLIPGVLFMHLASSINKASLPLEALADIAKEKMDIETIRIKREETHNPFRVILLILLALLSLFIVVPILLLIALFKSAYVGITTAVLLSGGLLVQLFKALYSLEGILNSVFLALQARLDPHTLKSLWDVALAEKLTKEQISERSKEPLPLLAIIGVILLIVAFSLQL